MLPYDSVPTRGQPCGPVAPDIRPSQLNNYYQRSMAMPYGRPLRGLGMTPNSPYNEDIWSGGDPVVDVANKWDDSVGNGIFDSPGSPPVQHAGAGVFEAQYAEPGYLYRENMTYPGEISDANTGGQMMFVPGGGGWMADRAQAYRPYQAEVQRLYGMGATDTTAAETTAKPSMAQWAVAGLVVGIAAAIMVGTLNVKRI